MPPTLYKLDAKEHTEGLAHWTPYSRQLIIDQYESLIWTERYIEAGDTELVIPATVENYVNLRPGMLLSHHNSQEVMLLDTRKIEGGMMTLTGKTLEAFFNQRWVDAMTLSGQPGNILGQIVQNMLDRADSASEVYGGTSPLPELFVGSTPSMPDAADVTEKTEAGPAYDQLVRIAKKYGLGMRVVWVTSSPAGTFELHFQTNYGVDYTTDNSIGFPIVRFSRALNNLGNINQLESLENYYTAVMCHPPQDLSVGPLPAVRVQQTRADSEAPDGGYLAWQDRITELDCTDITEGDIGGGTDFDKIQTLNNIMARRARAVLAQHKRTDVVDGEITPASPYVYIRDPIPSSSTIAFDLGDRVEAVGYNGEINRGWIMEYVRSSDGTGDRRYPTISTTNPTEYEAAPIAT